MSHTDVKPCPTPVNGMGLAMGYDAVFHVLILQSTPAFWDAYLRESANAQAWLATGGFAATLGPHGTFEVKRQAP